MDDLAAAVREMHASMKESFEEVKAAVHDNKSILHDLVAWRPQIDGAMVEMRADINILRQQLGRVALNPILSMDPEVLKRSASAVPAGGASEELSGDDGRGPIGHHELQLNQGLSSGGFMSPTAPPAKGTYLNSDPYPQYPESSTLPPHMGSSSTGQVPRPPHGFSGLCGGTAEILEAPV
jgi:hypothetical protein